MGSPKVVLDQDPISLQINTSGMHLEHGSQTHTEIIDFDTTKTLQRRTRALNHFQTNSNKLHRLSISCSLTRGPPVFCGRKEGLHFLSVCLSIHVFFSPLMGWGCSSVSRASDRHAADAGSIPRCGKGFFSQSQLSAQTLLRRPYTPVHNRMHLHLCAR